MLSTRAATASERAAAFVGNRSALRPLRLAGGPRARDALAARAHRAAWAAGAVDRAPATVGHRAANDARCDARRLGAALIGRRAGLSGRARATVERPSGRRSSERAVCLDAPALGALRGARQVARIGLEDVATGREQASSALLVAIRTTAAIDRGPVVVRVLRAEAPAEIPSVLGKRIAGVCEPAPAGAVGVARLARADDGTRDRKGLERPREESGEDE